jgi:hypothetical protein
MEELKTKRIVGKSQFTRAANSLRRLLDSGNGLEDTIRRKFEELSLRWQAVQDAHDVYMIQVGEESTDTESEWIDEMMTKYENIEMDADAALMKFKAVNPQGAAAEEEEFKHPINQAMNAPMRGHLQLEH